MTLLDNLGIFPDSNKPNKAKEKDSNSNSLDSLSDLVYGSINDAKESVYDFQNQKSNQPQNNDDNFFASGDPFESISPIVDSGIKNAEKIVEKAKNGETVSKNVSPEDLAKKLDQIDELLKKVDKQV